MNDSSSFVLPGMSDFHVWTTINKFSEIEIKPNTIVLCDIDDTFLHHPAINNTWTLVIYSFFQEQSRTIFGSVDNKLAFHAARRYIDEVIDNMPFQYTDKDGFFSMMNSAAYFAFVTARHVNSKEFTYSNLRSMNLDPENFQIHFCGDMAKGEYIERNFDLTKYDHVIFIDDQMRNLENVYLVTSHPKLELYQFKYEIEMSPYDYYPLPPGFNPNLKFNGTELITVIS